MIDFCERRLQRAFNRAVRWACYLSEEHGRYDWHQIWVQSDEYQETARLWEFYYAGSANRLPGFSPEATGQGQATVEDGEGGGSGRVCTRGEASSEHGELA